MNEGSDLSGLQIESELTSQAMLTYNWGKQKSKSKKHSGGDILSLKKGDSVIQRQENLILKKIGSFLKKKLVRGVNL